ncbi:BtuB Outer membrane cobalamin receptor protein [Burkholderiaceae bacterium]
MRNVFRICLRWAALGWLSAVCLSVFAQAPQGTLKEVVVTATRVEQPLADVLASVSVISRSDIDKAQAQSLAELLASEAGLEFARNGGPGTVTSFFLRGQESRNTVILIDGVRTQVDQLGALQITDMPLAMIEKIEVLKGNASALYGDAAVGGVINIFTRGAAAKSGAFSDVSMGSRNTNSVNVGYGSAVGDTKFNVSAGGYKTSGFSSKNSNLVLANSDSDGYGNGYFLANISQSINRDIQVKLMLQSFQSSVNYDGFDAASYDLFNKKNDAVGIETNVRWSDSLSSNLNFTKSNLKYEDYLNYQLKADGLYEGSQDAYRLTNSYEINQNTALSFGVDHSVDQFAASGDFGYKIHRSLTGYWLGVNSRQNNWSFQANIRNDQINSNQKDVADSSFGINSTLFGLGYQWNSNWRASASISSGFKSPTMYDISTNKSLVAETYNSVEGGVTYTSGKTAVRFIYFETSSQNFIDYNSDWTVASNIGATLIKGIESIVKTTWLGNQIKLNLVRQDPLYLTYKSDLARRARIYGSLDVSRNWQGIDIGTKFSAAGERNDRNINAANTTTQKLDPYTLWSFYASKKLSPNWVGRVKLENAFERNYQLAYGYNVPNQGVYFSLQYRPN